MSLFKFLSIIFLMILIVNCGNSSDNNTPDFTITTNGENNVFHLSDTLVIRLTNKKEKSISSIDYVLDGQKIESPYVLNNLKLGKHTLKASIGTEQGTKEINTTIVINNNVQPKIYSYKIINEYPHDITSYTQGLEFYNDTLYESTGQYKESKLRKIDFNNGGILKNINLQDQYFGEGITILNEKIYQLTWQSNIGFIYDLNTFKKTGSFNYGQSKEGWGLANNGEKLFKSDGTEAIYTLNAETLAEEGKIEVYTNNGKIASLNELEWINDKIFANIYQRNGVAIIDPNTGAVEGVIDFTPLKNSVTQHPGLDVLNGIAYNPSRNTIFVTGKRWDKLFEVEIFVK